jgi:hypothetical protein
VRYPLQTPSPEITAGFGVALNVLDGQRQKHPMSFQKSVHLSPGLKPEKAPNLSGTSFAGARPFERYTLDRRPRQIGMARAQMPRDVFRQL